MALERMADKLNLGRKLLPVAIGIVVVGGSVVFDLVNIPQIRAQSAQTASPSERPVSDAAPVKPMDPNADPAFEVATIILGPPGPRNKGIRIIGRRLSGGNLTVNDLISFSYGVQAKQISGGPPWLTSESFDVLAQPDGDGQPSNHQWKVMVQKLLADRFKFAFHREKQKLSVYTLVVGNGGPKLAPSADDPNGFPNFVFRLGSLDARNADMADFAGLMQEALMDRPVVDQTGLKGKFDFMLNWTPDEFQLGTRGLRPSTQTDSDKAAPGLYEAMQEQLGLKFESTRAPADVLVIDHVEEPSEN
jgi:uncharacterized protein (TIGR03435 family)